jgi:hypothetical protein
VVNLNLGAQPDLRGATVTLPRLSARCSLCEAAFRVGDAYMAIWPRRPLGDGVLLSLTVHRGCYEQLGPGDLTRIFAALEQGLSVPLRVLRARDPRATRRSGYPNGGG